MNSDGLYVGFCAKNLGSLCSEEAFIFGPGVQDKVQQIRPLYLAVVEEHFYSSKVQLSARSCWTFFIWNKPNENEI